MKKSVKYIIILFIQVLKKLITMINRKNPFCLNYFVPDFHNMHKPPVKLRVYDFVM